MSYLGPLLWNIYGNVYDGLLKFQPYQELLQQVSTRAAVQAGETVLDLGCGTGNLVMKMLSNDPARIIGVDSSKSMIKIAKRKVASRKAQNVQIIRQDVVQYLLACPSNSFDRIVSVNVIYALNDRQVLWRELLRVLKPGGEIIIATSVKTDSRSLIDQQLKNRGIIKSLHPKLVSVAIIDSFINMLGRSGQFGFPDEAMLKQEISAAGGVMSVTETCYADVDILFDVKHRN